jgi:hypothetical protein
MPYVESPLDRIVNVNWGGGFTAGVNLVDDEGGTNIYKTVLLHSTGQHWTEGKTLVGNPGDVYDNRAGAVGNPSDIPTFLLGGLHVVDEPTLHYVAWIERSTDGGRTWTRVYEANDSFVIAIVYDQTNRVFYAQATANNTGTGTYNWQVLKSTNGLSWTVVETSPIMTAAADPIYQDANHHNCPGGVYGYNKAKKILIAPYPDIVAYAYEGRGASPQIQIRTEDDTGVRTFVYKDIPGMDRISSVAYSGGVWQAAGYLSGSGVQTAKIATSTDDGTSWTVGYSVAGPIGNSAMIALGQVTTG